MYLLIFNLITKLLGLSTKLLTFGKLLVRLGVMFSFLLFLQKTKPS